MLLDVAQVLEDRLRALRAPVIERLQPGLPADQILSELTDAFGAPPPQTLIDWFSWHNGTRRLTDSDHVAQHGLVMFWKPLTLESAVSTSLPVAWLNPGRGRLLLFRDGYAKVSLSAEWDLEDVGEPQIVLSDDPIRLAAPSLEGLLRVWIDALDAGLYYDHEQDNWAAHDYELMRAHFGDSAALNV